MFLRDFFTHLDRNMKTINFSVLIRPAIVGLLCAEAFYFSKVIADKIAKFINDNAYEQQASVLFFVIAFLVLFYLIYRGFFKKLWMIIKSFRFDLAILFIAGICISVSFGGLGSAYYSTLMSYISIWQTLIVISFPLIVVCSLILRKIQLFLFKKVEKPPFFISDVELKSKQDDSLGLSQQAERFAERVFNQGASDSLVFGIEAPWGIGKSSFVNFCIEYWESKYNNQIIIYDFKPLIYENRKNLLEKFIDGLIRVIQKDSFVPEIKPLFSKYSRFIKDNKGMFSFHGFEIGRLMDNYSIDEVLGDMKTVVSIINKKIIIVVDDLDRLHFSEIQDVLFAVKKAFTLPNISYVLCYDSDNINALERERPDPEKVTEFLEKFVNVKVGIYLDSQVLSSYVSKLFSELRNQSLQLDPKFVKFIEQLVKSLLALYKSNDYHLYLPFLGDIRKIKRFINILFLLEVDKIDIENSDFVMLDIINLILIYINYPNVFRKIYDTETGGKRCFFSLVIPIDEEYPKEANGSSRLGGDNPYKNSKQYTEYIATLSRDQQFLLDKVFNVSKRFENPKIDSVSEEIKKSYACFNGNGGWTGGRNLEEYLNLIVRMAKPQKHQQYRFYLNCRDRILGGETVDSILSQEEFLPSKGESSHEQFWRVITNSQSEFDSSSATKLITYLLQNLPEYSLFTNSAAGVGLRDDLALFLVIMMDRIGWNDENGRHQRNTVENVAEIAEWIFGENRHVGCGVLETLGKEDRGVLGFYDLLRFRLFCSADRGGDMFNLQLALSKHGDSQAPTEGSIQVIATEEMREISQKTFQIFEAEYINKNKNFFDAVDALSLSDLAGQYNRFVLSKITSGEIQDSDKAIEEQKTLIKAFSIYQLGNTMMGHGVGCGYYDPTGKEDKQGINAKINDYLFNVCFDPANTNNYEHFLDYLFINFANAYSFDEKQKYVPSVNEFIKVIKKDRLLEYWNANGAVIKALNLTDKGKKVVTINYTASYKADLALLYQVLDDLVTTSTEPESTV